MDGHRLTGKGMAAFSSDWFGAPKRLIDIWILEAEAARQIAEIEAELHQARFSGSMPHTVENDCMHPYFLCN